MTANQLIPCRSMFARRSSIHWMLLTCTMCRSFPGRAKDLFTFNIIRAAIAISVSDYCTVDGFPAAVVLKGQYILRDLTSAQVGGVALSCGKGGNKKGGEDTGWFHHNNVCDLWKMSVLRGHNCVEMLLKWKIGCHMYCMEYVYCTSDILSHAVCCRNAGTSLLNAKIFVSGN